MGEASPAPEAVAKTVQDLTAMEVDPDKGERLYKAALVHTNKGVCYRLLSKTLKSGKLDLVHYGCDLDADGNPSTKWRIRRILEQNPDRFEKEIEAIKKAVADDGEQVQGSWTHDLTAIPDVAAQGKSLEAWTRKMATEIRGKPA